MLETELVPARERDSRRLMIVLHGLGDSREGYRWMPDELRLPWLNYLLVNAPDEYYGGYSWYDLYHQPEPGIVRSRELLFQLLDGLPGLGFDPRQTLLFGFSQGCLMTIEVGVRYPQRLAGLIGISGYVHQPEQLVAAMSPVAREQRFLVTHGTIDPLLPITVTRRQIATLRAAGLQMEWREFEKVHTIDGQTELEVLRGFAESCYAKA